MKLKLNSIYLEVYTVGQLANKGLYKLISHNIRNRILNKPSYSKLVISPNLLYERAKYKKLN